MAEIAMHSYRSRNAASQSTLAEVPPVAGGIAHPAMQFSVHLEDGRVCAVRTGHGFLQNSDSR